ncbi:lysophospholipase 1 [Trichomonascus vanleenenianus]|uniref:lysophospholipase 1 n=1 Tax=Trichomonascus vanleenenianus TaxID=2268995 RepID=UPI003ECA7B18
MKFKAVGWLVIATSAVIAWSPSGGYAPDDIKCPRDKNLVRFGIDLLPREVEYVQARKPSTKEALRDFLDRAGLDFDYNSLLSQSANGISIGLAFSGGGYRAMLNGAGALAALDARNYNTLDEGHMGGLLQAADYITGLSGGSWLLSSMYLNNYTTVEKLLHSEDLWNLDSSLFSTSSLSLEGINEWRSIFQEVFAKHDAGFPVTITDIWSRALARQFIGNSNAGADMEWSDMTRWNFFHMKDAPYPIILLNGPGRGSQTADLLTNTVFEVTPYELGSFDPSLFAFFPLQYLGTGMDGGAVNDTDSCMSGFDNASFMFGTSSAIFNTVIYNVLKTAGGLVGNIARHLIDILFDQTSFDVAVYEPNPFYNWESPDPAYKLKRSNIVDPEALNLVDGGEDNQVIPLQPLLHRDRRVDVAFAFDYMSNTVYNWPNGNCLVKTMKKAQEDQFDKTNPITKFPKVPDEKTIINNGYASRPTFFGCYETGPNPPPLVVYMANYPYTYYGNTTMFQMMYPTEQTMGLVTNGYNLMTQLNGTRDGYEDWPQCVSCAIVQREMKRQGLSPSLMCQQCLNKYCWDKVSINTADPTHSRYYNPKIIRNDRKRKIKPLPKKQSDSNLSK